MSMPTISSVQHNSAVYGRRCQHFGLFKETGTSCWRQRWIPVDLPNGKFDFIFCSPPWGGQTKNSSGLIYSSMEPFNLRQFPPQLASEAAHENDVTWFVPLKSR